MSAADLVAGYSRGEFSPVEATRAALDAIAAHEQAVNAFVLVDEGTAISQITDYPVESHLRGVVGHGAFGLAAGILLSLIDDFD
jgi:amidase/aspartyl-tRNA(Asn)/glutamyl-tRNA(Gln) amidotransferase subunit A